MKLHFNLNLITLLVLIIFVSSCYKDNEEELYPTTNSCDTTKTEYTAIISKIIESNCLACHSNASSGISGGGISLEGHTNLSTFISNNSARFIGSIEHSAGYAKMPAGGNKLSDCDISLIKTWITNGSKNN